MSSAVSWIAWMLVPASAVPTSRPVRGDGDSSLRVACPHCTNTDTVRRHCRDGRCGWLHCTCGALVYSRRRHRHPRHGSEQDTCHDPTAAV